MLPRTAARVLAPAILLVVLLPLLAVYLLPAAQAEGRTALVLEWSRPFSWSLAGRSIGLALLATAFALILGTAIGMARLWEGPRGRFFWFFLALLPLAVPPHLAAIGWLGLVAPHGLVGTCVGICVDPVSADRALHSWPGCALLLALCFWPIVAVLVRVGRGSLDPSLTDATRLHLPPGRGFRRVLVPALAREFGLSAALVFVLCLAEFSVPSCLQINTYALEVFTRFEQGYDHVAAAMHSLPMLAGVTLLGWVIHRWETAQPRGTEAGTEHGTRPTADPRALVASVASWLPLALALTLGVLLPVLQMLLDSHGLRGLARAWEVARRPLTNTLVVSCSAAVLVPLLGGVLALATQRLSQRSRAATTVLLSAAFALPASLTGIGLVLTWNRGGWSDWVYTTPVILILAALTRFLVVPWRLAQAALQGPRLEAALEAAHVHGLPAFVILRRILLPALAGHLRGAACLVYVLSMGELGSFVLVQPPGWDTLPIRLFQLIHYGYSQEVAAMSVLLLALVFLPAGALVVWQLCRERGARRDPGLGPRFDVRAACSPGETSATMPPGCSPRGPS